MVPMAYRIDQGSLRPVRRLAGGGIRADARLTRSGVFVYMLPDGTIQRELRPDEEVFRRDSMETAECLPVGDDHPPEMVTPETEPGYRKGLTGENARRDGNWLVNSVVVRDPDLVEKIERGKVFVSCGYECDFRPEKGTTPSGEKYDGIQENIRYNHLAFVEVPRAGTDARVRMDDVGYRIDWNPDQPRAENGQFGEGEGTSTSGGKKEEKSGGGAKREKAIKSLASKLSSRTSSLSPEKQVDALYNSMNGDGDDDSILELDDLELDDDDYNEAVGLLRSKEGTAALKKALQGGKEELDVSAAREVLGKHADTALSGSAHTALLNKAIQDKDPNVQRMALAIRSLERNVEAGDGSAASEIERLRGFIEASPAEREEMMTPRDHLSRMQGEWKIMRASAYAADKERGARWEKAYPKPGMKEAKARHAYVQGLKASREKRLAKEARKTKKDSKETDMPNLKQKLARALKENEALRARADARFDGDKPEEDPADEAEMDEESEDEEEDGEKPAFRKKDSADIERLTARCDSLEAENKKLRQQLKSRTDSADITARVKTRVKLITQATPVLRTDGEDDPDLTAMNDREIKLAVVKRLDGFDATKKSDDYLDARFDAAMERFAPDTGANETQPVGVRNDSGDPEAQAAARMREATANRWKTGKKEH